MDFLLIILTYLPITLFIIMSIRALFLAIRYGEEQKNDTKIAVIVGAVASVILFVRACLSPLNNFWGYSLALLSIALTCLLKRIIRFFTDDFDKKHQIPVDEDNSTYRFEFRQDNSDNFLDENARFNGEFKDFDDDD